MGILDLPAATLGARSSAPPSAPPCLMLSGKHVIIRAIRDYLRQDMDEV